MKVLRVPILILLFSSLLFSLSAQPIVDVSSSWIPGDSMFYMDVDTNNIYEGDEGEDVNWFFNGLQKQGPNIYNSVAKEPSSTPFTQYYPDATYSRQATINSYTYYNADSAGLLYYGYVLDTFKFVLDDPLTLFPYPLEYGYTYKDNALNAYKRNGKDRVYFATSYAHADAYGTLYLPDQLTLSNCLRVKFTLEELDYDIKGGDTTRSTTTAWYWFAPSIRGNVYQISHKKVNRNGNVSWINTASYRTGLRGPFLYMDNISGCAGSATEFYVNGEYLDSIKWDFGDAATSDTSSEVRPLHAYLAQGTYQVTVTGYTGSLSTTLKQDIEIHPAPNVYFPDTILFCRDEYNLVATVTGSTYRWQDGSTDSSYEVVDTGLYWVKIDDGQCVFTDSAYMADCGSTVYIPTLFTPNGDGMNDVIRILGEHIREVNWVIYNRWGQLVYSTKDLNEATTTGWDGTVNGKEAEAGSYTWYIRGAFDNNKKLIVGDTQSGSFLLIR